MRKTIKFLLGTSCAALMTMASLNEAGATDDKSYPAFTCLESGTGTSDFDRSEYRITRTGSAGTGLLLCPLVRDTFESGGIFSGYVMSINAEITLQDNHFTENITCTIFNKRLSDGSAYSYKSASTEGSSATVKKLLVGDAFTMEGYAFLKCSVPTNGSNGYTRIFAYKVKEGAP
jgi:hypothetical protein